MPRQQIKKDIIKNFYESEIKSRKSGEYVKSTTLKVGFLSHKIFKQSLAIKSRDLYTSARVFMHIKERRQKAFEEIIIPNAYKLFSFPDYIYENERAGEEKRGDILLAKELGKGGLIIAIFEVSGERHEGYSLVTIFLARQGYLKGRNCIWKRLK